MDSDIKFNVHEWDREKVKNIICSVCKGKPMPEMNGWIVWGVMNAAMVGNLLTLFFCSKKCRNKFILEIIVKEFEENEAIVESAKHKEAIRRSNISKSRRKNNKSE